MAGAIRRFLQAAQARRVAWRRGRNLRAAPPPPRSALAPQLRPAKRARVDEWMHKRVDWRGAGLWIGVAGVLAAGAGAVVIARHAQSLAQAVELPDAQAGAVALRSLPQLQAVLPGQRLSVPAGGAIDTFMRDGAGVLLLGAGARAMPPLRIDLCQQMRNAGGGADGRHGALAPLRVGYSFDEVARWVGDGAAPGLRAVALAAPGADLPKLQISGDAASGAPLRLRWEGAPAGARWVGDTGRASGARGEATFMADGWLVWRADAAIHLQRQRQYQHGSGNGGSTCGAGQLLLQVVRTAADGERAGRGFVTVYPGSFSTSTSATAAKPVSAWLAAGDYQVPASGPLAAGLEDQALFDKLRARGMVRLGASGLAELAPRDLPAWRAAPATAQAGQLAGWDGVKLDDGALKLLKHLYRMADGAYVREQVRIFNGERRLLAWRMPLAAGRGLQWQAADGATVSSTMPASATRLFAAVGQGWQPWSRVDNWPAAADGATTLRLSLAQPARAGQSLTLMLIGRLAGIDGAQLRQNRPVCDGRACPSRDAAQLLVLDLPPGATSVSLRVTPLDMAVLAMPGDQQYRHLRVAGGQLDWLPLPAAMLAAPARQNTPAAPAVVLEDRNGAPLWAAGAPTAAASAAGLAPLLGFRAEHAASVAGMLARLPDSGSMKTAHHARLTLDLALQTASQRAIDCVGMRHGSWDGASCSGGQAPPAGRHAGMVILDAETGDILAAAGAGGPVVDAANWQEVRNFDRSDPARSPLRLPALQHDGGAHASPGSTFKIISALGLEQAAKSNPRIDALLGGLPLADINRMARQGGFAFQTDAAVYPFHPATPRLAHVTNYKSQALDRRAVDGRVGLAQALTYSVNTWFAWSGELSDASLFGRADGGVPDLQPLEPGALDGVRPIVGMARRLGFGQAMRLDGGLLPADFNWGAWDALQASASSIDAVHTRHELRQMAIGLRMQVTPLQMALAAAAIGQGSVKAPRLLLELDGRAAPSAADTPLGLRLDRIRAGMKGVIDIGTAAGAFKDPRLAALRRGLFGKTGTAPTGDGEQATVWFTGFLEPGSLPGQNHRLALAAFVSHSAGSGGEHAAPIVAAVLADAMRQGENVKQRGK